MSDNQTTCPTRGQIEAAALALANYDAAQVDCPLLACVDEFRFDQDRCEYEAREEAALNGAWRAQ